MVVMGGPWGVVEVGSVVEEGIEDEVGVAVEEAGASVVVEASTDETTGAELDAESNVVEFSGSGTAEEESVAWVVEVVVEDTSATELDTDSNVVEISASVVVEEDSDVSVVVEASSDETTGTEVDTESNVVDISGSGMAVEETMSDVTTDESVDEGLHLLPGRATAEARKRGKSDSSRAVEWEPSREQNK